MLGYLKDPLALSALAAAATDDPHPEVRRAAAGALSFARDARVIDSLSRASRDDIGDPAARPALEGGLDDPDADVRKFSALALGKLAVAGSS